MLYVLVCILLERGGIMKIYSGLDYYSANNLILFLRWNIGLPSIDMSVYIYKPFSIIMFPLAPCLMLARFKVQASVYFYWYCFNGENWIPWVLCFPAILSSYHSHSYSRRVQLKYIVTQNRIETEQNQFFVLSKFLDYRLNLNEMIHIWIYEWHRQPFW